MKLSFLFLSLAATTASASYVRHAQEPENLPDDLPDEDPVDDAEDKDKSGNGPAGKPDNGPAGKPDEEPDNGKPADAGNPADEPKDQPDNGKIDCLAAEEGLDSCFQQQFGEDFLSHIKCSDCLSQGIGSDVGYCDTMFAMCANIGTVGCMDSCGGCEVELRAMAHCRMVSYQCPKCCKGEDIVEIA